MTQTKSNRLLVRIISILLAVVSVFASFSAGNEAYAAAKKSPVVSYAAVKKAYGKSFPLSTKNRIKGRKNILGVNTSNCSGYYAAQKFGNKNKEVYEIFICKAKKGKKNTVKNQLKSHVKNEKTSMQSYLSKKGKKLFSNYKVGTSGDYVYLVMVDTSGNKKAVNAIKKSLK